MKIVMVSDIPDWAIGHLAQSVVKYNTRHKILQLFVHPRDAGDKDIQQAFLKQVESFKPDLIDFEYYRTAGQLLEALPELYRYKLVLMHHNMRDKALYMWDWGNNLEITDKKHLKFNKVLCHCNKTKFLLEDKGYAKNVGVIRYGFDHDFWTYSENEPKEITLGYSGRIVPWKMLKEVAEVAKELNVPLQIMGKQDKADYWDSVPKDNLRFDFMDCKDEERVDFFRNITIFIQNSKDGYEEGPMPLMEAMACGVPVITTPAGQAGHDEGIFKDRENCLLIPFESKETLKIAVKELIENKDLRKKLRKGGWNTVKNMTEEKMAKEYSKVWNKVIHPEQVLASVIITTTYDRKETLRKILQAYNLQSYSNIEVLVVYDEEEKRSVIDYDKYNFTIKEFWTLRDKKKYKYNLAMARNLAIIEAEGEIIIINDSRLKPEENAVIMFVEAVKNASSITMGGNQKVWFFGDKGSQKQSFVENFSAVRRDLLIQAGMFCERIDKYGGMTQEVRSRWIKQKGEFTYLSLATASEVLSSKSSSEKRRDIVDSKLKLYKMYGNERI